MLTMTASRSSHISMVHCIDSRPRFPCRSSIRLAPTSSSPSMSARLCSTLASIRRCRWSARKRGRADVSEHRRLTQENPNKPRQMLLGVVQGAQYEDLRRLAARGLAELDFDGFGIGGALEKENLGTIVRWVCEELPDDKPRHLLGISEPDDLFTAIENGADTFDCVTRRGWVAMPPCIDQTAGST